MTTQKFITYTPLDINGKQLSDSHELKLSVLENSGNYLLHKDVIRHSSSQTQGTTSTKTRSEVRGGGSKPWRQKGTGRARAGSSRSPLWKGGGVIFGPKPKKVSLKLNKKERRLALQTLLYNKKNNIVLIEDLENGIDDDCDGKIDEVDIGDLIHGGIVFWVDPNDNFKGKVCDIQDAPNAKTWNNAKTYCTELGTT